jgi:hypothetical protein
MSGVPYIEWSSQYLECHEQEIQVAGGTLGARSVESVYRIINIDWSLTPLEKRGSSYL